MKLVRYGEKGAEKPGLVDLEGRVRCLAEKVPDIDGAALDDACLTQLRALDPKTLPLVDPNARLGVPISGIGKIMCIGLNYHMHIAETGSQQPSEPMLFMKATSSLSGPRDPLLVPRGSVSMDWECELGVVIGTKAKYVSEEDALKYVAGYTIVNDVSERDFQKKRAGQFTKGKSCDTFCPVGPWVLTADEVPDPQDLRVETDVNGVSRQDGHSSDMIHSAAKLVSYLSQFMTLHPGDIIATGTPAGVGAGMEPPLFLKAGDEVALRISSATADLGEQCCACIADD